MLSSICSQSKVKILISDKYNPGLGLQPFDTNRYEGLTTSVNKFHAGEMNSQGVAYSIIEALFSSEFSGGGKWDVESATCSKISSGEPADLPAEYQCSQRATWDHKDIYSVAEAKAKIVVLSREEIHIVLYSYYVSG